MTAVADQRRAHPRQGTASESGGSQAAGWPGAVLAIVVVGMSGVLAGVAGAWGIARTDDWAFARVAFRLNETGHLGLVGWGQMNLIGLVAWAQPFIWVFGPHQWVLDVACAVLVALGVWASYRLARRVLTPGQALLAVGSVAAFPGFLRDATSFMTDGPAFAVEALCLLAGVAACEAVGRRRSALVAGCIALGLWGFTIREFAIAAPLAVLLVVVIRELVPRRRAIIVGTAFLALCAVFYAWRTGLPGEQGLTGRPPVLEVLATLAAAYFTTALGLAPSLVASARRRAHPMDRLVFLRGMMIGLVAALVPAVASHRLGGKPAWLVGDYLDPRGINGQKVLLGNRPLLFPAPVWDVLVGVAVVSGVLLAGVIAERLAAAARRPGDRTPCTIAVSGWFLVLLAGALAVAALLNGALFDRYLWPLMLAGSVVLLWHRDGTPDAGGARAPTGASVVLVALLVLVSVAVAANSDAYDAARWHAGGVAVAAGAAPTAVDAGFEWTGAHTDRTANLAVRFAGDQHQSWWTRMFSLPTPCAEVANGPILAPGYTLRSTTTWHPLLVVGSAQLYLYARPGCGLP